MIPSWRYRHPLLAGWWIAIAQNVAPKRFHARERRRTMERHQNFLAESGMAYSLVGVPLTDGRSPDGGLGMLAAGRMEANRGAFGRRRPGRVSVLSTAHGTSGGGEVRFTSRRRSGAEADEWERALLVHDFLTRAGLSADPRVETRQLTFGTTISRSLLAVAEDAWHPWAVVVDGDPHEFTRFVAGEHWLALGVVGECNLAIEGRAFDPARLEVVRVGRPEG